MQRLDHAMIYVKVAGTVTPFLWIGASPHLRAPLLVMRLGDRGARRRPNKLVAPRTRRAGALAARAGLPALPALPASSARLPADGSAAARRAPRPLRGRRGHLLSARRPSLWPGVFSFHELFHLLLVFASACIYVFFFGQLA